MGEKVRIGFVGVGWMGEQLFEKLVKNPDATIVGLSEKNSARAEEILLRYGLSKNLLVENYEDLLERKDVNAVVLASPNAFHGPQAVRALETGKHVFCEKPAATKYRDFLRQVELDSANPNLATFIDYILYFDEMENRLHKMVREGAFGQIVQIQVNYRHPVNIKADKVWKLKKDVVGDGIGMGPIHAIFLTLWHMEEDEPIAVHACSMEAKVRPFEVPPIWNIMIEFKSGATGIIQGNIDSGNRYDAYHNLWGTKGEFVFDSQTEDAFKVKYWSESLTGGKWVYPLNAELTEAKYLWPNLKTPDSGEVIHHQTQECTSHFVSLVKEGKKSPLGFANSRRVAEIGFAAIVSDRLGHERVRLPLDKSLALATLGE